MTKDELYDLYFDTKIENDKLRALACYLYYVNPRDTNMVDDLMREVGLNVEDLTVVFESLMREVGLYVEVKHTNAN